MAVRLPRVLNAKQIIRRSLATRNHVASSGINVPKGCCAVYVGEGDKKRFVIPISNLSQPSFQNLLTQAEEEFGYSHPMGGLTIPCGEDIFIDVVSQSRGL